MTAKPGDRVKVVTADEIKEGILMPNEETGSIVIKLDNGYNIGIDNKKVNIHISQANHKAVPSLTRCQPFSYTRKDNLPFFISQCELQLAGMSHGILLFIKMVGATDYESTGLWFGGERSLPG